ncbi:MAG: TlpA family protein disulfide reductase [Planctomycetes bacterium]|nr:TlpA family protein disulfide reductase [Planctomycetota bacterium]MCB9918998.1 TlpA family protein disulfide reductase [Planctomycetota bacterium]
MQKHADKPFAIVGVNSDPDLAKLRKTVVEKELTWPSFFDGGLIGGPIATQWGVRGWPTVYVLDAKGVIRFKNARGAALDRALETLFAELDG